MTAREAAERYLDDQTLGGYLAWPQNQIEDAIQDFVVGFNAGLTRAAEIAREDCANPNCGLAAAIDAEKEKK